MKSAATIRTCSTIMMIITICVSLLFGLALLEETPAGIVVMVVGIFSGIMMNALFKGFADIIDNTYAVALKASGVEVAKTVENATGDTSFQEASKVNNDKKEYANDLLSKGLINEEEYAKITGGAE